ncbi:MAG: DNA primase [Flavobacteriaceae bacterium]|nr:DNA primase [Flavobacteriaceae bacterium]
MTKIFNPKDWLEVPKEPTKPKSNTATTNVVAVAVNDIESYISAIEQSGTDITGSYATWRDLGFALAEEYGEIGRDYFHRISKNYAGYDTKECDEQFDKCLNAKGHGITIATFYHYAHQSSIKPTKQQYNNEVATNVVTVVDTPNQSMPTIPETVYENLPQFLQQVVNPANGQEEKDILFLGALTAFSACFPKLFGIYDQRKVFSNLYLFVTAPASAGKGRLNQIKNLVEPVHKLKREQAKVLKQQFQAETATYNMNKGKDENLEKPSKPPERMLFIPANNSVTGVYQLISDNKGRGLIFETEGDTLAQAFKSDYGNYSDGFRKAFHHETISYYRRTDREYVDIEKPCLSTVLSGTPKQVATLIPNAENGLFSRFMFYYMNIKPTWKNVFQNSNKLGLDDYYNQLGSEFLELYKTLKNNPEIEIRLTTTQQQQFNTFFESLQTKYINLQPEEYIATIRRLGLIAFRIMMLFTAFRIMEDGDVNATKECEDIDFENALTIISILVKHSSKVFNDLPIEQKATKRLNRKERFLESLPKQFSRQEYLDLATKQSIPHKTAEGYITKFVDAGLIYREAHNSYSNPAKL